jgi:hypothetical protein
MAMLRQILTILFTKLLKLARIAEPHLLPRDLGDP